MLSMIYTTNLSEFYINNSPFQYFLPPTPARQDRFSFYWNNPPNKRIKKCKAQPMEEKKIRKVNYIME